MYISEWEAPGGGLPLSNIRVTTKVAVNALLGDTPTLVNYGSALMANLGDKEVKAVVCILQFIGPNFFFNKFPFDIFTSKYEEAFCEANLCLNKPPVINSTSSFITVRIHHFKLSSFQVFDDVCSELAMAILQFFQVEINYQC